MADRGAFIGTTQVWDLGTIKSMDVQSDQFKNFLVHQYQTLNSIAMLLNIKDTGQYSTQEFVTGKSYIIAGVEHSIFRKVIFIDEALKNNGVTTKAHGLTTTVNFRMTDIYGTTTKPIAPFSYLRLPFASPNVLANNISLEADGTNVIITTGNDRTAFTQTYIVCEFYKF